MKFRSLFNYRLYTSFLLSSLTTFRAVLMRNSAMLLNCGRSFTTLQSYHGTSCGVAFGLIILRHFSLATAYGLVIYCYRCRLASFYLLWIPTVAHISPFSSFFSWRFCVFYYIFYLFRFLSMPFLFCTGSFQFQDEGSAGDNGCGGEASRNDRHPPPFPVV